MPPSGAFTEGWLPTVTDVAAADDGFVATAYSMTDGIDGASAWWSPDGRRWESHSLGAGSRAATVIRTADGWMIGGSLERGDEQLAAIWTSPDGRTWTRNQDDPVFAVGELRKSLDARFDPGVQAMATMDGLVVATGYRLRSQRLGSALAPRGSPRTAAAWTRNDPDTVTDLPHFTTALADRIITMAYTDSGLTRVYGFDPAGGWTLLKDDLGFVQEAVPVDGGVAVATGDSSGVSDLMTIRFSRDGRSWSDVGTIDPGDVRGETALTSVSLSDDGGGGIRAQWFALPVATPLIETARSAVWCSAARRCPARRRSGDRPPATLIYRRSRDPPLRPRPPLEDPPAPRGARSGCASWSRRGMKPSSTFHGIAPGAAAGRRAAGRPRRWRRG